MTPPTRYALVPVHPSPDMIRAIETQSLAGWATDAWANAVAASPNAGCVTAEMLERAAIDAYAAFNNVFGVEWMELGAPVRALWIKGQRAALTAIGLAVSDETQRGEAVDG